MGNLPPITREEKGSEGRSLRALGAERGPRGSGSSMTAERVAKPCGRHLKGSMATGSGRLIERWGEKRGVRFRQMLKSEKASARRFLKRGFLRGSLE